MKNAFRRFLRNKRAVTPVLSELLLTVIAVAAMSVATTATYVITNNLRDNMSERVVVEDVWFNTATHTIDVYMNNVGKVAISASNVYINHTLQPVNFHLDMNQQDWLNISSTWNSGEIYYIDVVTTRGLHIADYYKAP